MPRCLLIYTGGTIGMIEGPDGSLHVEKGNLQKTMNNLRDIKHEDIPDFDIIEWDELKDSSDITPSDWVLLANTIEKHYYNYEGFVIIHGTDTMAYTASALSFMMNNLNKTVIITGSMLPISRPVSDGRRNLFNAMMLAVNPGVAIGEVCIFMDTVLLRGNRSRKTYSTRPNAFISPNMPPLAVVGVNIHLERSLLLPAATRRLMISTSLFTNITSLIITPGSNHAALIALFPPVSPEQKNIERPDMGLILYLFGSGNPSKQEEFLELLSRGVTEYNVTVVIGTQCEHGYTDLNAYENASKIRELGVISSGDMTPEATTCKLSVLMGQGFRGMQLKKKMEENMRGELTDQHTSQLDLSSNIRISML